MPLPADIPIISNGAPTNKDTKILALATQPIMSGQTIIEARVGTPEFTVH